MKLELYQIDAGYCCGGVLVDEDGTLVKYAPVFSALRLQSIKELTRYYKVVKIAYGKDWGSIERPCWNCFTPMNPTEETFSTCRMFKCPECGSKFLWLDEPTPNNTFAWKHYSDKLGGHSTASMMSDPECGKRLPPPPKPGEPIRIRIDKKSFRWHKGKERWVLWE